MARGAQLARSGLMQEHGTDGAPGGGGRPKQADSPSSVAGLGRFLRLMSSRTGAAGGLVKRFSDVYVAGGTTYKDPGAAPHASYGAVAAEGRSDAWPSPAWRTGAARGPLVATTDPEDGYPTERDALLGRGKAAADGGGVPGGAATAGARDVAARASEDKGKTSLLSLSSVGLPLSYFFIGISTSFITTPLSVYMVTELGAEPQAQNTIGVLTTLPWSFKLACGFISDVLPLCGSRRRSYMAIGALVFATSYLLLAWLGAPSLGELSVLLFLATVGAIMVDVMADTLVVERAAYEPEASRGQLQASCYAMRFFGAMLGACAGTVLYNKHTWGWGLDFSQVCLTLGLFPLVALLPAVAFLWERPLENGRGKSVAEQCRDIWDTVQLRTVWRPMAFVYCYNILQIPNVAWSSYLQLDLGFEAWALGVMATCGSVMTFLGILAFKKFFFRSSWRSIYLGTTVLTTVFSLLQLVLIFQLNRALGLSDYLFALGDDVVSAYISGIQFLPICLMYMKLCPGGSEGATYAMLTTFGNIALCCSSSLGASLANLVDVSNAALEEGRLTGLAQITMLTSAVAVVPLTLLWLLPAGYEDQLAQQKSSVRSKAGGAAFLAVLVVSMLWTSSQSVLTIMYEDHAAQRL